MRLPINSVGKNRSRPNQQFLTSTGGIGGSRTAFFPGRDTIAIPAGPQRATCDGVTGLTCWRNSLGNCVCSEVAVAPPK